ncbi:ATP-dependent zinc metalloprotease FtsH [Salibacteraceae bacterium]|jgi:ATP-dependent metalloprotease FtsH|nr:ATP-dependent zinc metalloprotease FtsH [Flavobacteriales bacterium]MDB9701527.1 ATP-dependent zinc metalloprotease FtsH [Salibacteraceae bacterium]
MSENSNKKGKEEKGSGFKPKKKSPLQKRPFNPYWIYVVIAGVLIMQLLVSFSGGLKPIDYKDFVDTMLLQGDVAKVKVIQNEHYAEVFITAEALEKEKYDEVREKGFGQMANTGPHYRMDIPPDEIFKQDLEEDQESIPEGERISAEYENRTNWSDGWLSLLLPIALMVGIWIFIMRRMSGPGGGGAQIFNIGKSKAVLFDKNTQVKVTFKDVAGQEEAKEEIEEIVDFLKNPDRYTALGAHIPKGALLVGPPGTGKTLLAKAVAGEAQVPFFSLSGSDFVEMFVGVGASRVRDLFKQAKEKAPSIIFIDEIDAIGRARGKSVSQGANDERENTLNQLLTEMDGFGTNSGVIIMAATNRADILDGALLRPGRFDRQIHVDMPDLNERKEIFKVHLQPLKLDDKVDVEFLARQTPGFSGADIANICNEAALIAARRKKTQVEKDDFVDAVDRIVAGLEKKSRIITPGEKKAIAYHEAGHAAVSWLTEYASPLVKVTIVPRGRSLGAAWYLPEERQLTTKAQMIDEMCAALGGRASEEIVFGEVSTGALSDLEKVTKQAYAMVSVYGLNDKIGNISFYDSSGQSEYSFQKPYSEKTAETIDSEVKLMIDNAYQRTIGILNANRDKLNALAELLLEKEVIFKEDMETIFGKRTFKKELEEEETARKLKAKEVQIDASEVKESEEPIIADEVAVPDVPSNPETKNPDKNESSS